MSFKGKVVVVTGSSSGIGAAAAIHFAREGADVVITGRNEKKLKNVSDQCAKVGKAPLVVVADITDEAQSKSIIYKALEKFGKLDVLVNNAGYAVHGSILDGKLMEAYDGVMATNLRPVFYLTELAAPHLIKTKGNIVNVSSAGSLVNKYAPFTPYCATKAALDHFSRGAAMELGPHGVRVNVVLPGPVRTDFLENSGSDAKYEDFGKDTLLNRVSASDEIADIILYLASDKAKGITGASQVVDNGWSLFHH